MSGAELHGDPVGVLRAGPQSLTRAASLVQAARSDLAALQAAVAHEIEAMRAGWSGDAALAFMRVHTAWQDKQARITQALDTFEGSLLATGNDNAATDQRQSAAMAHLAARLG